MALEVRPGPFIIEVPHPVNVVGHEVEVVDVVLQCLQVKPTKVPVAAGNSNRNLPASAFFLKCVSKIGKQ